MYVNAQEAQTYSTSETSTETGIKYMFEAKLSSRDSESWFNGNDRSRSQVRTFMEGGDPGLASNLDRWDEWISSSVGSVLRVIQCVPLECCFDARMTICRREYSICSVICPQVINRRLGAFHGHCRQDQCLRLND